MKNIRLILLAILTLAFVTGNAQIKIEKRKHLKGYHFDRVKKHDKVSDITIKEGERITAEEVAKAEAKEVASVEEPNVVVLPVSESSFYSKTSVTEPKESTSELLASNNTKKEYVFNSNFFRKGAGLVLNKNINVAKEKLHKVVPAAMAGPGDIFAIIGFIAGILSILSFLGPGLIFFGVIGLIFSLLGMDSSYGNFARWGLILSIIGLALALLYLLVWAAYW